MNVWAAWPSVDPARSRKMALYWGAHGYYTAVLMNPPNDHNEVPEARLVIIQNQWRGFPAAANILCRALINQENVPNAPADIVVLVGDDVFPDTHHTAEELASRYVERFPDFEGVIQPTGDKYGCFDKCAVSPWIGKGFIQDAYNGKGPFWEEYYHYFSDEELQAYATSQGKFDQWDDVEQFHDHWQRREGELRPRHLIKAKRMHRKDKAIFVDRKAKGFPC